MSEDLIYRLRKRAEIRRQITTRKSVQEGQPDRIADLLEEAAGSLDEARALLREARDMLRGWYGNGPTGNGPLLDRIDRALEKA